MADEDDPPNDVFDWLSDQRKEIARLTEDLSPGGRAPTTSGGDTSSPMGSVGRVAGHAGAVLPTARQGSTSLYNIYSNIRQNLQLELETMEESLKSLAAQTSSDLDESNSARRDMIARVDELQKSFRAKVGEWERRLDENGQASRDAEDRAGHLESRINTYLEDREKILAQCRSLEKNFKGLEEEAKIAASERRAEKLIFTEKFTELSGKLKPQEEASKHFEDEISRFRANLSDHLRMATAVVDDMNRERQGRHEDYETLRTDLYTLLSDYREKLEEHKRLFVESQAQRFGEWQDKVKDALSPIGRMRDRIGDIERDLKAMTLTHHDLAGEVLSQKEKAQACEAAQDQRWQAARLALDEMGAKVDKLYAALGHGKNKRELLSAASGGKARGETSPDADHRLTQLEAMIRGLSTLISSQSAGHAAALRAADERVPESPLALFFGSAAWIWLTLGLFAGLGLHFLLPQLIGVPTPFSEESPDVTGTSIRVERPRSLIVPASQPELPKTPKKKEPSVEEAMTAPLMTVPEGKAVLRQKNTAPKLELIEPAVSEENEPAETATPEADTGAVPNGTFDQAAESVFQDEELEGVVGEAEETDVVEVEGGPEAAPSENVTPPAEPVKSEPSGMPGFE